MVLRPHAAAVKLPYVGRLQEERRFSSEPSVNPVAVLTSEESSRNLALYMMLFKKFYGVLGMGTFCIEVPRFRAQLHSQFQLPSDVHTGR